VLVAALSLDWLDGWRVEDQIAFSGDIEFDEKRGKLRRKP
jgi:hypothetical protein